MNQIEAREARWLPVLCGGVMAEVKGYTIRDARPKIAEVYWPYFIVRFETTEGPQVELRFHKQALEYFAEEIKNKLHKEEPK